MPEAYPLLWPPGWPRAKHRESSQFKVSIGVAFRALENELKLLGARQVIVSSNLFRGSTGVPLSGQGKPKDPGVAVYFKLDARDLSLACDRYEKVEANMRALHLTVAALRGIERWGSSGMVERAFTGFAALPAAGAKRPWWEVLGTQKAATIENARAARNRLARIYHPDAGGSEAAMAELNDALAERERMG